MRVRLQDKSKFNNYPGLYAVMVDIRGEEHVSILGSLMNLTKTKRKDSVKYSCDSGYC